MENLGDLRVKKQLKEIIDIQGIYVASLLSQHIDITLINPEGIIFLIVSEPWMFHR